MQDFMPLLGWDHVELWVGNAKQSAYFYERALGFTRTAYAGPETGVRDRASYVLEQGDIRLVLTTALREDHEISRHQARHGDGVRDIALTVPDATEAYRQAVQRGARGVASRTKIEDEHGARGARGDRDLRRHDPHLRRRERLRGRLPPGLSSRSRRTARRSAASGLANIDHIVGNVELGQMDEWVEFYERVLGLTEHDPLLATRRSRRSTRR